MKYAKDKVNKVINLEYFALQGSSEWPNVKYFIELFLPQINKPILESPPKACGMIKGDAPNATASTSAHLQARSAE